MKFCKWKCIFLILKGDERDFTLSRSFDGKSPSSSSSRNNIVSMCSSMISNILLKSHLCHQSKRPELSIMCMTRKLESNSCLLGTFKMGRLMIKENNRKIVCIQWCNHLNIKTITSSHGMNTTIITTYEIDIPYNTSLILKHLDAYWLQ